MDKRKGIGMMEEKNLYQCVQNKLRKHNQLQLLKWYAFLGEKEKQFLLSQLNEIDYINLEQALKRREEQQGNLSIEPIEVLKLEDIERNKEALQKLGMTEISKGRTAVVLLAGGQGSRMGLAGSKGMLDIGLKKPLYLFEIVVRKLKETAETAGCYIDLYIMVNERDAESVKVFFQRHDYFGYPQENILFFSQKMYPKLFFDGTIALEQKGRVAMAPGGNGAWFEALQQNHFVERMQRRHIRWINLLSVDNPLYTIIDTAFLGALIQQGGQLGVQVVEKSSPYEKVGVICKKGGRPYVREYYEMSREEQEALDEQNELCYRYGVILNYMFDLHEMENIHTADLPVHLAVKKIPFVDQRGKTAYPERENGYIAERLALDMIHLFERVLVYEVDRKKCFAPIKNRLGEDSIETARALLAENGYVL